MKTEQIKILKELITDLELEFPCIMEVSNGEIYSDEQRKRICIGKFGETFVCIRDTYPNIDEALKRMKRYIQCANSVGITIEYWRHARKPLTSKDEFNPDEYINNMFNNYVIRNDKNKYSYIKFFGFDLNGKFLFSLNNRNFSLSEEIWKKMDATGWSTDYIKLFFKNKLIEHFEIHTSPVMITKEACAEIEDHFKIQSLRTSCSDKSGKSPTDTSILND